MSRATSVCLACVIRTKVSNHAWQLLIVIMIRMSHVPILNAQLHGYTQALQNIRLDAT